VHWSVYYSYTDNFSPTTQSLTVSAVLTGHVSPFGCLLVKPSDAKLRNLVNKGMQINLSILRLSLSSMVIFCFCFGVQAQKPAEPQQQADDVVRTNIELVQTDLAVFDRQGAFVSDLRPEQFILRLNGNRRAISMLGLVTAGSKLEAAQVAAARSRSVSQPTQRVSGDTQPSGPGRLIFFFVDDVHLAPRNLERVRSSLFRFVNDQMGSNDQVAVVSTSGLIGFLQQLTDNQTVLRSAIGRLGNKRNPETYAGTTRITEYMASQIENGHDRRLFAYLMESVKLEYGMGLGALRGDHGNDSAGQASRLLKNRLNTITAQSGADTAATLGVLQSLMKSSASLPGRKLVFLFSDGFIVDQRGSNALDWLKEVTQEAAKVGAVIYTMDTRGIFQDSFVDVSSNDYVDMSSRHAGISVGETTAPREPLSTLADETGGRAIFNSDSIDDAIRQAVRETSEYYVLAWRPEVDNERRGKVHIEVSIQGRPDLRVLLRRNYFRPPDPKVIKSPVTQRKSPETELLATLGSPHPLRTLPTSLSVGFVKNSDNASTLKASMQIERDAFASTDNQRSEVDVVGAAIDDRGLIYSFKEVLTVVPQGTKTPVVWTQQLKVKPGLYQVRVAVRERESGRSGSAMQWIEIPEPSENRFSMSSLFLGERQAGLLENNGQGPQPIRVDVDHSFPRTSVLRFQTYVYNASRSAGVPDVWIEAQVLRGNHEMVKVAPRRIPPDVSKDPTLLPYWTEIALDQLPTGRYTLRVSARDKATNNNASQTVSFSVE